MSHDPMDLPARRTPALRTEQPLSQPSDNRIRLNDQHVSTLVDTGAQVAGGIISIAKSVVDIARIKATSQAEVASIEARSRAMTEALRAETAYLMETHQGIRTRGEAVTLVIRSVLENIPVSDHASRQQAITILNDLVANVVGSRDTKGILS